MRRLVLALWLCLGASPAFAGFTQVSGTGTGGAVFNTAFFGGNTCSGTCPTTTVALNAGDIVAVYMQQNAAGTPTFGCSDGVGNTWQAAPGAGFETGTGAATEIWYSRLTSPISSGSTITCTNSLSGGFLMTAVAFRPAGTAAFDTNATGQASSGTSVTVGPTPTLACPGGGANCEVCIAGSDWHSAGTTTSDAAFITTGGTGVGNPWTDAFKLLSATTAISYTATDTTSTQFGAAMACFKDTVSGGASVYGGLTTTGVGP